MRGAGRQRADAQHRLVVQRLPRGLLQQALVLAQRGDDPDDEPGGHRRGQREADPEPERQRGLRQRPAVRVPQRLGKANREREARDDQRRAGERRFATAAASRSRPRAAGRRSANGLADPPAKRRSAVKAARSSASWAATAPCVAGAPRLRRADATMFSTTSAPMTIAIGTTGSDTPSSTAPATASAWPAIATLRRSTSWRRLAGSAGSCRSAGGSVRSGGSAAERRRGIGRRRPARASERGSGSGGLGHRRAWPGAGLRQWVVRRNATS